MSTWASNMWSKAKETGRNFINGIIDWFKQLPGRVSNWITDTYNRVTSWANDMIVRAKQTGRGLISSTLIRNSFFFLFFNSG